MDIDLGVFPDLDRKRWDLTSAPRLLIVNEKAQALVKGNEPFSVRGGDSDMIDTHGWHVYPPSRGDGVYTPQGAAERGRRKVRAKPLTLTLWRDCVGAGRSPSRRERGLDARGAREFPLQSWHDDGVHHQTPLADGADVKAAAFEYSATASCAGIHKIGCGRCGYVQRAGERCGSTDMRMATQHGEHSRTLAQDVRQGVAVLEQVIVLPRYAARDRGMMHHDHMTHRGRLP